MPILVLCTSLFRLYKFKKKRPRVSFTLSSHPLIVLSYRSRQSSRWSLQPRKLIHETGTRQFHAFPIIAHPLR